MTAASSSEPAVRVTMRVSTYDDPDVVAMVREVQEEYVVRYGGEDDSPLAAEDVTPPQGLLLVASFEGQAVGCGAFRQHLDVPGVTGPTAEIRRMYVRVGHRGRGVARAVLAELEARASAAGYAALILETGEAQPEAMALYVTGGYVEIEGFGHYRDSPLSHCYAKDLRTS